MLLLRLHDQLDSFRSSLAHLDESENSLLLGLLAQGSGGRYSELASCAGLMIDVHEKDGLALVAYLRDSNLILARGPSSGEAAVEMLAAELASRDLDIPGVVGPAQEATSFARAWTCKGGGPAHLAYQQMIYQLSEVTWPPPCTGSVREVEVKDQPLLKEWLWQFHREALSEEPFNRQEAQRDAAARVKDGRTFLWESQGQPRAMAALVRPTEQTISINAVYTPQAERGHGYASNLVAKLSAEGLRRGKKHCVLYADQKNPIANSIYPKIGYRPICSSHYYRFLE